MGSSWKPSTLLVLTAFALSIILLFAKSELMLQRLQHRDESLSHHVYSPAAADPDLRNPEKVSRLRADRARAQAVSNTAKEVAGSSAKPGTTEEKPISSSDSEPKSVAPAETEKRKAENKAQPKEEKSPSSTSVQGLHPRFKPTSAPDGHQFFVVFASFQTFENAEKGLEEIRAKGFPQAYIGAFNEGKYYSIIGQTFKTEPEARELLVKLEKERNIKALIYRNTQ